MVVDHKSFQLSNLENQAFLCRQTPDELHNYIILETIHCMLTQSVCWQLAYRLLELDHPLF